MRLSHQGKYSTTAYKYSRQICKHLKDNIDGDARRMTITDACGGNGGDTTTFSRMFKSVNSVEKDLVEFKYLEENITFQKLDNVRLFNKSYLDTDLTQDIVYFDPPWGGPGYKAQSNIDLFLDEKPLQEIVADIFTDNRATMVAIKAPNNFNIRKFSSHVMSQLPRVQIQRYNMPKFYLLVLKHSVSV